MLKIMYQEDSNKTPVTYRRVYALHQAVKCMDNEYSDHRHYVSTGDCTGLIIDLRPVNSETRYLGIHVNARESEFFPGYFIAGIRACYYGFWDYKFIALK